MGSFPCRQSGTIGHLISHVFNFTMTSSHVPAPPPSPRRRWLLKAGLALGAVGAALGGSVFWNRGVADGKLTPHGRSVLRGVARAVLSDVLPASPAGRKQRLDALLPRLETIVQSMPPSGQQELAALLGVLANAPARLMVTGLSRSWDEASTEDIAHALESMRVNALPTTMMAYHAVRDLTAMAYFADPENWPAVGYPGPLVI